MFEFHAYKSAHGKKKRERGKVKVLVNIENWLNRKKVALPWVRAI